MGPSKLLGVGGVPGGRAPPRWLSFVLYAIICVLIGYLTGLAVIRINSYATVTASPSRHGSCVSASVCLCASSCLFFPFHISLCAVRDHLCAHRLPHGPRRHHDQLVHNDLPASPSRHVACVYVCMYVRTHDGGSGVCPLSLLPPLPICVLFRYLTGLAVITRDQLVHNSELRPPRATVRVLSLIHI